MKKNIGKRMLSLALALVMVAGWMPRMATEAHAAGPITLEGDSFTTDPGQGFTFRAYYYCGVCKERSYPNQPADTNHSIEITSFSYKISQGNISYTYGYKVKGCDGESTGSFSEDRTFDCSQNYNQIGWLITPPGLKTSHSVAVLFSRSKSAHQGDATCKTAANCTLCGTSYTNANNHEKPNEFTYSVNTSDSTKHDVKYACCGATKETVAHTAEPTYTVNVTDHTKHDKTYSCCEGIAETTGHSYTYTADGSVLTEKCSNGCGHQAIASIVPREAIYTGSEITDAATISYDSGTWAGDEPVLSFENNVNVGTATVKMTAGDATASTTFKINPASLSYATVTLDPASGVYDGDYHNRPTYTLTYNGKELDEGTDYIVDGQWTGDFLNAGDSILTLKGEGNFTGYNTLTYTIHKAAPTANLFEMTLPQNPVYDGTTTFPVTVTPKTTDLGEITAVKYNGSTEAPINAGTYKVTVDVAESENYNAIYDLELGSFTIAPTAGSIIIPANQSVVYDGAAVEQSDLTPAITTDGALTVKWYDSDGTEIAAPTDVGTYQIGISAAAGSNYNAVEEVKQTFTITKADPICTAPTANNGLVYNGKEQMLISSAESSDGTVYYSLDGDNYTESLPKGTNAKEYTVYYKVVGDANHNDMEPKTVTAKIAPWNIETAFCKAGVPGGPFTYNGQEHTPTPQIDVWVNDYPVPGNPHALGADVRLTEGTDYTVAYSDNVNAGQAVVTFTGKGNYTGTITRKFTIDPKPITVTIADKTSVYGEAVAELTAATDGIVNNDTNVYSLATTATSTANAGTYPITGTTLDSNYAITFLNGTYTITKAPVNSTGTDMAVDYTAGMEVDLRQMFTIDENAGEADYWITHLTGDGSFTSAPYLYRIDKAGTFTVKITTEETANYNSGTATAVLTVNPGDPGIGAVTAGVVNDTLETSAIVPTRENTDVNGNLTVDAGQTLAWGDNTIRYTFTPNDTTNYKVVKGEVTVSVVDTIAPVGTVSIDDNKWNDLWNTITFGLFFKETKTVKVAAEDVLSGIAKVECYDSATALSADAVKAITAWNDMGADYAQDVTAEDAKTFIYYIRITDKAGNVTYISTADATYDLTKPAISGITNGSTYYTTQKVTVTDKNIDTITLNGEAATDAITLEGNKEATYTIVATDKAGNSTTVTVTMKPIKELAKATENLGNDNVTSADAPALEELVAKLDELIADPDTSDDGERETLEQHKVIAEALLKTIEDVAKATDTENTAKVEDVTADNVTPEDKSNLEDAKADLEDALENNGGNYTEEEKQVIQDEIQRIEDAMVALENVEDVTDSITQLPETVEPDDEETAKKILDAKEAYDELTDHEKSLVDETTKKKLDDLVAALTAYDIIKGDGGKWTKGGSTGLPFTANGPFSKFVGIEVDGKEVDEKYYDAKAGSTIITLKQSYLKRLSTGEHTITVLYTDGETSGTFKILAASSTPATGDNSNIMLYGSMFTVSLAGLVVLLLAAKKRKQETA